MQGMEEYIWQRRIHHGVRRQKGAVPFPESVKIGLDFNAAFEREEKLDPRLLTNAVMQELCNFSRTVTRSETYFLFEMLEFNFDLGLDLDDGGQWYEYAKKVRNKVKLLKEQIRTKPRRWTETFQLPDPSSVVGPSGPEASGQNVPGWNRNMDSSVLSDFTKTRQPSDNQETGSDGAAKVVGAVKKRRGRPTADAYPFCKSLGVALTVRPDGGDNRKMDPNTVTNGVMLELLHFSAVLCGKFTGMISELVKQNFGLEMDKVKFRVFLSRLTERRNTCLTGEDKDSFRTEPCQVPLKNQEPSRKKRKRNQFDCYELERLMADRERREVLSPGSEEPLQDGDLSYTCPVECDAEMQPSSEDGPEEWESCFPGKAEETSPMGENQEEDLVSPQTDGNVSPSPSVHPKTRTLKAFSDLFSEVGSVDTSEKTAKQKLWMRRAPRSKQILNSGRVNDIFCHSREAGLDFNIGSGNKQNLDKQLLTNAVLLEIYRFGTAMSKSLFSFVVEILQNNFSIVLRNDLLRRNFIYYIMTKEKVLQNHADRLKPEFLSRPFHFPDVYRMVSVTGGSQPGQEAEADAPPSLADPDQHPYCARVGVDLWLTEPRPASRKVDVNTVTVGAVFEMFAFVRELCAPVRETVNDVLEHNFDLELHSGTTTAAQVIQRWYPVQKTIMKRQNSVTNVNRWLSKVVPLDGIPPPTRKKVYVSRLRGGEVKVMEELPSLAEEKPQETETVISYHICQKIGLELDVSSKPAPEPKLDLGVLTRGALFEMHHYVSQNRSHYVPALYEILDYNFDLSSQKHRQVEFAWSVAAQVIAIAGKTGRKEGYMSRAIELPFEVSDESQLVCKEEPEDGSGEGDFSDQDLEFVRELKPVDIEVEVE